MKKDVLSTSCNNAVVQCVAVEEIVISIKTTTQPLSLIQSVDLYHRQPTVSDLLASPRKA